MPDNDINPDIVKCRFAVFLHVGNGEYWIQDN
jgi:hypothetical protein